MNTLRSIVSRARIHCTSTACRSGTLAGDTRGRNSNHSKRRSEQIPPKSGKQFYKNVIAHKRDAQYKQVAELDSISKSLAKQRRNPALKLRQPPTPVKSSKKDEIKRSDQNKDGPIHVDKDYAPLSNFPPDLMARATRLFTRAALVRRIADSVDLVRSSVFEHHGKRLPEIAIIGRSNVGKSSILNALLARDKALTGPRVVSNVSSTPGCTRALHFLQLEHSCVLVDLPGYGYAAVGVDMRRSMTDLISAYWHSRLEGRSLSVHLRRVIVLIDSRVGISASDEEVMRYLSDKYVPWILILTKTDKLSATELQEVHATMQQTLRTAPWSRMCYPEVLLTSTHSSRGIEPLRALILESCETAL